MLNMRLARTKLTANVDFTRRDMAKVGVRAMELIRSRVSKGLNVHDRPMPPLSKLYAAAKRKLGQPAQRNMMFSGSMLGSMVLVEVSENRAVIGFTRQSEQAKALANQNRRGSDWFGLSPTNEQQTQQFADRILRSKAKGL